VNKELSVLGGIEFDWPELKTMAVVATIGQSCGRARYEYMLLY